MRYSVKVTEEAKQDLYSIFLYILENSYSVDIAKHRIHELEKAILSLETMPYRHMLLFPDKDEHEELRVFHIVGYAIVYEIDEPAKCLYVLAVFSDKRQLPSRVCEAPAAYSYQNG